MEGIELALEDYTRTLEAIDMAKSNIIKYKDEDIACRYYTNLLACLYRKKDLLEKNVLSKNSID